MEQTVENSASDSCFEGGGVALLDLAKDFGFSKNHGVEAADDSAKVDGGFAGLFLVKVLVGRDSKAVLEMVRKCGGCFFEGVRGEIELGTIAGGDDHSFCDGFAIDESTGFFSESSVGDRDLLAQLNGRGFMIEAKAEELHKN